MSEPLPLPADPRHQRFADLRLADKSLIDAYIGAGFKADRNSSSNAKRIEKRQDVMAYTAAVRQAAAQGTVLTVAMKREFFYRIVTTPLTKIDPGQGDDPNLDLIRKWKLKRHTEGRGDDAEEVWTEEIEKHCPLKAIALDNKLSGDDPETNAMQALAEELMRLGRGNSPLPDDRM